MEWSGADWADVIMASNSVFLQDYATITGKPIATQRPSSVMGVLTGSDLSTGGASQGIASSGVVVLVVLAIAAVIIFKD